MNTKESNSIEIDLLYLLKKLWEKKILILFSNTFYLVSSPFNQCFVLKTNVYFLNAYLCSQSNIR